MCVSWGHFIRRMCTWTKCTYQLVRQVQIKLVIPSCLSLFIPHFLFLSHSSNYFLIVIFFPFPCHYSLKHKLWYVFSHVRLSEYELWSADAEDHLLSASRRHELNSSILLCTWTKEFQKERKPWKNEKSLFMQLVYVLFMWLWQPGRIRCNISVLVTDHCFSIRYWSEVGWC